MKKNAILILLSAVLFCTPISTAKAFDREFSIPTEKVAVINGNIQPKIKISEKKSIVNPWIYVDIKLDSISSYDGEKKVDKIVGRIWDFFAKEGKLTNNGGYIIILNNGFIIDKQSVNHNNGKVKEMLKKEVEDRDFFKGDTIFTLGFLYGDNEVKRTTYWKLIDTIDLPAGSTHSLNKKYTVGINKNEELTMGKTLGLKFTAEANASFGTDFKYGSFKTSTKLSTELNSTASKNFTNNKEIKSLFESNTNISYGPDNKDKVILRYQLVDNYKVTDRAFKKATVNLNIALNKDGEKLVKLSPSSGKYGIDVPHEEIFDVTLNK